MHRLHRRGTTKSSICGMSGGTGATRTPEVFGPSGLAIRLVPFGRICSGYGFTNTGCAYCAPEVAFVSSMPNLPLSGSARNQKSTQPERAAEELLQVVRPYIFSKDRSLSRSKRTELKGKWIFNARFLKEVEHSLQRGEKRWRRWLRLAWFSIRNPSVSPLGAFAEGYWVHCRWKHYLAALPVRLTPGALWLQFRRSLGMGCRLAWYRDVVRLRILKTPPVENTTDTQCEIHVLTSERDWLDLIWALKSFYLSSGRHYALCIHEDGSLNQFGLKSLRRHFRCADHSPRGG